MLNYDLPWNSNRLEQRFGRIHRIGQTEVCHLWNLVAGETREGYVYERLLRKLETESTSLEGKVFDVLGKLFEQTPLRKLLVEAIRYGDRPEVRAKLEQTVDNAIDQDRVRELLETQSLVSETMDTTHIMRVCEEMERYAARRLQPHYITSFFMQAFETLGGSIREREPGRYHISYVPARIRNQAKELGTTVPVWETYDRVCFDKELMAQRRACRRRILSAPDSHCLIRSFTWYWTSIARYCAPEPCSSILPTPASIRVCYSFWNRIYRMRGQRRTETNV